MHLTMNVLTTNSINKQQMTNQAVPNPDLISLWDCPTICNDYIRQVKIGQLQIPSVDPTLLFSLQKGC